MILDEPTIYRNPLKKSCYWYRSGIGRVVADIFANGYQSDVVAYDPFPNAKINVCRLQRYD